MRRTRDLDTIYWAVLCHLKRLRRWMEGCVVGERLRRIGPARVRKSWKIVTKRIKRKKVR